MNVKIVAFALILIGAGLYVYNISESGKNEISAPVYPIDNDELAITNKISKNLKSLDQELGEAVSSNRVSSAKPEDRHMEFQSRFRDELTALDVDDVELDGALQELLKESGDSDPDKLNRIVNRLIESNPHLKPSQVEAAINRSFDRPKKDLGRIQECYSDSFYKLAEDDGLDACQLELTNSFQEQLATLNGSELRDYLKDFPNILKSFVKPMVDKCGSPKKAALDLFMACNQF